MSDDYTLLTAEDELNLIDSRVRALEAEVFGHKMFAAEQGADPHASSAAKQDTAKTIESLETRLGVLRPLRASAKAAADRAQADLERIGDTLGGDTPE